MKPFLKWVGGKTQILQDILVSFPREMVNYHEPFLGGGSVLLGFLNRVKTGAITLTGTVYASDLNANLIHLYKNIQSHPEDVIREVKQILEEFVHLEGTEVNRKATTLEEAKTSKESYYFWIRTRFNALSAAEKATPRGSAMLLFMNKTCFRGVYREGPKGFNVPYGNYKNPTVLEEDHIRAVSALIRDVVFRVAPFQVSLADPAPGDFVYMDPPYAPETTTSFVGYTADGFNEASHAALFDTCNGLRTKGVTWCMSNAAVQKVKDAFPAPYMTQIISCRRAIHSKTPDAKTNEVLIKSE